MSSIECLMEILELEKQNISEYHYIMSMNYLKKIYENKSQPFEIQLYRTITTFCIVCIYIVLI